MTDPRLRNITIGQGSFGKECIVCLADDYYGILKHKPGCEEVWQKVLEVRHGT